MILNIFKSTTDTLLFILTIALIVFTYTGIVEPLVFGGFLSSVASYKFGRNQAKVEAKQQLG